MAFASWVPRIFAFAFSEWSGSYYWLGFAIPQAIYPVASVLLFSLLYRIAGFSIKDTVKAEKSGVLSYLLYIPAVIFASMLLARFISVIFEFFRSLGVSLPTIAASIPTPSNAVESVALIIVMAVLPALCEEFIYRFTFIGMLSPLSRGGAIIVSSLAFGLMHGTVEQIFATFCLGLCLAFIYVYTGNYRLPVAIHFVNNFISCISIILGVYLSQDLYYTVNGILSVTILISGVVSLVILLFLKKPSLPKVPEQIGAGEAVALALKAPMFWVFTVIYIGITMVSTLALA